MLPHPLPNAELHMHVEGALQPELLVRIAARNGIDLPITDPEALRARYVFEDLQSFLDVHYANLKVLRTEQDFYDLAASYLEHARAGASAVPRFSSTPRCTWATACRCRRS